ncbi:thrombospondin type 3 repeat-containing protein [Candidatus Solirubrobacter pratensis]|uniref:thrombospondin type 3 repeat-containing protein n=1 Tax=Candidatus Solirubrobacter pratensis TaxID=1298857 RepID=UPI0004192DCE|nr:thrombospondin type 3 repeat-containing protein [Candidatus Solirubrobacter pratensis]
MKLALGAVALATLALAAPAQAIDPGPAVLDFEAPSPATAAEELYPASGAHLRVIPPNFGSFALADGCGVVTRTGHDSPQGLDVCSGGTLWLEFDQPQTSVSMFAAALTAFDPESEARVDTITAESWPGEPGEGDPIERVVIPNASSAFGVPVVLGTRLNMPAIRSVTVTAGNPFGSELIIDDITFGAHPQPDTEITAGPATVSRSTDAAFAFTANQSETGYACSLDGAPAQACRPPFSASGLAEGSHTFTVAARDRYGTYDPSPAAYSWAIDLHPPPSIVPAPDGDRDGVADALDNCPAAANAGQADSDKDGVGDACEVAEPGTLAPVTGSRVVVTALSGDVFVKLPADASSSRRLAQTAPISGYVPLKGIAALPTGTLVDARKGRVALDSTVDGRRIGDGGARQRVTLAAGIFRIRQARAALGSTARVPTDLILTSAPGAESGCLRTPSSGPIKGRGRSLVRTLAASTHKGLFRIVGAAATSTAREATWITQDRCDGTRTEVGKGRVTVAAAATATSSKPRTVTVRSGRSYTVKARLFAAKRATR